MEKKRKIPYGVDEVRRVCGNTGYNWFDLPESKPFQTEASQEEEQTQKKGTRQ